MFESVLPLYGAAAARACRVRPVASGVSSKAGNSISRPARAFRDMAQAVLNRLATMPISKPPTGILGSGLVEMIERRNSATVRECPHCGKEITDSQNN